MRTILAVIVLALFASDASATHVHNAGHHNSGARFNDRSLQFGLFNQLPASGTVLLPTAGCPLPTGLNAGFVPRVSPFGLRAAIRFDPFLGLGFRLRR